MSQTRRAILIAYAFAVALACVWVPWDVKRPSGAKESFKYGLLWSKPQNYRKVPPPPSDWALKEAGEQLEIEKQAALAGNSELASAEAETVRELHAINDENFQLWEKSNDEYERTTLEIGWDKLVLELAALTALCAAALLLIKLRKA